MATRSKLDIGDRFPALRAPSVDGDEIALPDDLAGRPAVVLLYRGHW